MAWLMVFLGYLIGSIPTAYIAGRWLKGEDIRQIGDLNMGAQNAYRQLGPKTGISVAVFDIAKGAAVVLIAQAINAPQIAVLLTGIAAVIGHNWPVFIGFKGGRGESTTFGVLLAVFTLPMLITGLLGVLAFTFKRNITFASAFMFGPLWLVCWWWEQSGILVAYSIALPCLVGLTHFLRLRRAETRTT